MRNRLMLCLLICGVLMYYAVPRLTIHFSGLDGIFAFSWFMLAFLVIGGNLAGFLYTAKKEKKKRKQGFRRLTNSQKARRYLTQH
ncbi:hypothetical protein [Bacillus pinisoli]|uniref:hypothetical protein n=1 Tax=Bacillus pinisoli TaxID=2901866 RepID=UPI001FF13D52|nr:hypothetical protein [Bacillus pinisoli]